MADTTREAVNRRISGVVRHFLLDADEPRARLAEALSCHPKTLQRRLGGAYDWTAWEVAVLAVHFDVPEQVFHDGPARLMAYLRGQLSAYFPTDSRLIAA